MNNSFFDSIVQAGDYILVTPIVYRDKDKFWYSVMNGDTFWHRQDGPAVLRFKRGDEDWHFGGNRDRINDKVISWCLANEADIADLTEREILIMWSEINGSS